MEMNLTENPLRKYLETYNLTPEQFSRLSGVPQPTISRIINGKSLPQHLTASKICRATNGKLTLKDFGIE